MKNNDLFTKRFLSVSLGISAILLSGSIFMISLNTITRTNAEPFTDRVLPAGLKDLYIVKPKVGSDSIRVTSTNEDVRAIQAFGIGVREGILYFGILYNNNTVGLHKTEFDSQDILHW